MMNKDKEFKLQDELNSGMVTIEQMNAAMNEYYAAEEADTDCNKEYRWIYG